MCQGCLNIEGNLIPHFIVHIPHYHKGYRSCIRAMYTVAAREVNFPSIQPQTTRVSFNYSENNASVFKSGNSYKRQCSEMNVISATIGYYLNQGHG
jgi:hypothetical protein